jgi:uncharacterized protein YegP (UPF0339 family)
MPLCTMIYTAYGILLSEVNEIMTGTFEVWIDKAGEFRFNLKAANGEVIATSEGYKSKDSCMNGIESVKMNAQTAKIVEREQ